jgi:hypothetical protein
MFYKVCIAVGITLLLMFLIWIVKGLLLMPVPLGKTMGLTVVLKLAGSCPELEGTVNALLWMIENGTLTGDVLLLDKGMDPESRQVAELMARDHARVTLRGGDGQ